MSKTEQRSNRSGIALARGVVLLTLFAAGGSMFVARSDASATYARNRDRQAPTFSPIVELRQYTLHPSRRDGFVDLFDREFVESQEALGMKVIGQFRDLDEPSRFVWLRGFPDMPSRARSLTAFYDGALWKSLRDSANAAIIDNDNVLLLHPAHAQTGFVLEHADRPAPGAAGVGTGLVIATIYHIDAAKAADFADFFDAKVAPLFAGAGAAVLAEFLSETGVNTFPRLPVREGEHVFVWFSRFPNATAYERFTTALSKSLPWRDTIRAELTSRIREPQVLRLAPTARSLLHD
jgi:hypothetical protein